MPAAMTFTTLQEDLRRYLERGYTAGSDPQVFDQLPSLINLGERRCAQDLKVEGFLRAVTANMSIGQPNYAKPDRWRETVSINIRNGASGARSPVFPRSYEYCRSYAPDPNVQDKPLFYADYDYLNWLVVPTPDVAYIMEVLFYETPPLLDDTVQTNWLTEYAPNLLLYASLVECAPFLKDDARIATWEGMYQRTKSAIDTEDLRRIIDRTSTRNEP